MSKISHVRACPTNSETIPFIDFCIRAIAQLHMHMHARLWSRRTRSHIGEMCNGRSRSQLSFWSIFRFHSSLFSFSLSLSSPFSTDFRASAKNRGKIVAIIFPFQTIRPFEPFVCLLSRIAIRTRPFCACMILVAINIFAAHYYYNARTHTHTYARTFCVLIQRRRRNGRVAFCRHRAQCSCSPHSESTIRFHKCMSNCIELHTHTRGRSEISTGYTTPVKCRRYCASIRLKISIYMRWHFRKRLHFSRSLSLSVPLPLSACPSLSLCLVSAGWPLVHMHVIHGQCAHEMRAFGFYRKGPRHQGADNFSNLELDKLHKLSFRQGFLLLHGSLLKRSAFLHCHCRTAGAISAYIVSLLLLLWLPVVRCCCIAIEISHIRTINFVQHASRGKVTSSLCLRCSPILSQCLIGRSFMQCTISHASSAIACIAYFVVALLPVHGSPARSAEFLLAPKVARAFF